MHTTMRRRAALVLGPAAIALICFTFGRTTAPRPDGAPATVSTPSTRASHRPAGGKGDGTARGASRNQGNRSHTASGALSAAANDVAALGSSGIVTPAGRAALIRHLAAPDDDTAVRAALRAAASSPLVHGLSRDAHDGVPFVLRTVPIALDFADAYHPDHVTVRVYEATYVAGSQATAGVGHGRATIELVWAGEGWKVTGVTNRPQTGPIPAGYLAPDNGWQPGDGDNLADVSQHVRTMLTSGKAPHYVVR